MHVSNAVKVPRSLRSPIAFVVPDHGADLDASLKFTVVCRVAAGSIARAEAP
jgi:hypothetical protein